MLFYEPRSAPKELKDAISKSSGGDGWNMPWPLPNMAPLPESRFWGYRASMTFKAEVWVGQKKIDIDGQPEWANILVYWLDQGSYQGGGFAVAVTHKYGAEKVRYFGWRACEHDFAQKNIGNCLNRYTCTKCGASHDVDSSG